MGANKLKTAAEAAGYAMVNPEDFAREPKPLVLSKTPTATERKDESETVVPQWRWWPSLDVFGLNGGKATA